MRVSFTSLDLKSKIKEHKQRQDEKIMQNLQAKWSRKECNIGLFGISSALVDWAVAPLISKQIINKTNIKSNYLSVVSVVGFGIFALGSLSGYIFNKIDEKKNTKLGNFAYMLFNGPNSLKKNDSKINANV